MRKSVIIITNIVVMALIFFFIIQYAYKRLDESNNNEIASFEKMTTSAEQVVRYYLEDEQHICDIWSNYVNRSAEEGSPMTAEEAIAYIRRAKLYPSVIGQIINIDAPAKRGISTSSRTTDPNDYTVSYQNIDIFENLAAVSSEDGVVNLTRAYTNPTNGTQSIAFLNFITLLDEETGKLREALLIRSEPLKILEEKLVFLKGEYESVEIALISKDGNYVVHGKSFKSNNFYEFYKSYNDAHSNEYNEMVASVTGGTGTITMKNSKGEDCFVSYTPLSCVKDWVLLAYIPAGDLLVASSVDWLLLGTVAVGLIFLLVFNFMILMRYNKRLAEAAEAANQANEAKSHFLSTMSHDIRTPMNAILGLNEMVLRDSEDESVLYYSENIKTAGNTLLGLINDILDFSKIEAGKMELVNVDYNFVSMLNDLVNMVQRKAEEKGLKLILDVDRNIPMILNGDEIRIKQVITNILSNAVKYTKEGSITFFAGYEKAEDDPNKIKLKISVTDTGIGIKEEDLARLFVAFERIEEKRNRNIEGTGLGMTIAQSFLNMMGSHLEVESEYGKGSTFSFELVQEVKDWQAIGNYEEAFKRAILERSKYHEKFIAPHAHVLVVDDTPVNLTVFESLLSKTKIQIDTAENGDDGIVLFKKNHYDVIFLDHMMPDKDGIETLKEMKEIKGTPNDGTPIVCLTANAISGMREMYINAGFDDYITKPIDPDRLESLLLQYLPKGKIAPATGEDTTDDYLIPDFLFRVEDLDINSGLTHCGSRKSYMMTLKMYLDSAADNVAALEEYWAAGDIKNTTIRVHALKSTSRVIGALRLGDFAARLEKAGDAGDTEALEKELGTLIKDYQNLANALEPLRELEEKPEEDERPTISAADLKEAYETLAEFCATFDYDSVVHVVESLDNYKIPEDEATRFDAIKRAVDNFDYDLIPGILTGGEE